MTAPLPRVADLAAVVRSLPKHPSKRKAIDLVRRMEATQSCITDLTLADQNCETLGLIHQQTSLVPLHKTTIENALLANSCILYARATATAGKLGSRGSVSIRDRLLSEEREDHDKLIRVRNRALAHVHSNEEIDESVWNRGHAFAVEDERGAWLPAAAVRRIQSEPKAYARLQKLIPRALAIQREIYDRQIANLIDALHEMQVEHSAFEGNLLDATILFGSEEEAAVALGNPRKGSRIGVINHQLPTQTPR